MRGRRGGHPPEMEAPHVLREYSLIADGERGALIGPRGDISWLCFPRWDSPAVFAGLLGGGGAFTITPAGRHVWGGYYEPGSLIWRNRWVTEDGIVECREALALPARADRMVLLRRIEVRKGRARLDVTLDLRCDYGRRGPDERTDGRARLGDSYALWTGTDVLELAEGQAHDLVLILQQGAPPEPIRPEEAWAQTEQAWRERVPPLEHTLAPRDARHACAVLSGLTSAGGGMVAAATMSLPERASAGRSYDYRYVWIRDQCYAGRAVAVDGAHPLLDDAVRFVTGRLLDDGSDLRPAYTVTG